MVAPVTKSDARDAKKTAVPAHSSGLPKRAAGVRAIILSYKGVVFTGATMSVSIHPGAIAFTWILNGASSIAIDLVSCTKAPFAAVGQGSQ